jgi:hypothetical protein
MSKSAKEGFEKTDEKRLQSKSTIAGTRQIIPHPGVFPDRKLGVKAQSAGFKLAGICGQKSPGPKR